VDLWPAASTGSLKAINAGQLPSLALAAGSVELVEAMYKNLMINSAIWSVGATLFLMPKQLSPKIKLYADRCGQGSLRFEK
jgi:hypothetical protein